jgi:hypothetical protein
MSNIHPCLRSWLNEGILLEDAGATSWSGNTAARDSKYPRKGPYLQLYRWYLLIAKRKDSSLDITRGSVLSVAADIGALWWILPAGMPFDCNVFLPCSALSFPPLPLSRQLAPTFSNIETSFGANFCLRIPALIYYWLPHSLPPSLVHIHLGTSSS